MKTIELTKKTCYNHCRVKEDRRGLSMIDKAREISPEQLEQWAPDGYLLIDIRDEEEYETGKIPGALHMEQDKLPDGDGRTDLYPPLPRDKKIVVYCKYGTLSGVFAEALTEQGYDAYNLAGGYGKWLLREIRKAAADADRLADIEKSLRKKRFKRDLYGKFVKAICDYDMIREGDKIAVCISGGKDSMLMVKLFQELKRHNKFPFELVFLCMDPGYNAGNRQIIENNARLLQVPLTFFETEIFDAVFNIEKSPCYICARMRRGYLYKKAQELGCNKIALGHHFDDVIETIVMGMLYSGQFQAMMPKLHSTNFGGMELIRPMYLIREEDIKAWRDANALNFIQCACKFTETCTTCHTDGTTSSKRLETKKLIARLKEDNPFVEKNIFKSMESITPTTILGYKKDGVKHSFLEWYDREGGLDIGALAGDENDERGI